MRRAVGTFVCVDSVVLTRKHMEELTFIASAVAVTISLYALKMQRELGHETSTQTLIHAQYELCRVLDQMRVEHPEISHVLALPVLGAETPEMTWQNYKDFKDRVRDMFDAKEQASVAERAKLYLKEHAMALHVFDIYEQTLKQRKLAEKAGDWDRLKVLKMLSDYYERCLLRNPRLRFHWDRGGSDMMDDETRERYECVVRKSFNETADDTSPLDKPAGGP